MMRRSNCRHRIIHVVAPGHLPLYLNVFDRFATYTHFRQRKTTAVFAIELCIPINAACIEQRKRICWHRIDTEALSRRPTAAREDILQCLFTAARQNKSIAWEGPNEVVKLPLNRLKVIENIGVIELKVIKDRRARCVMNKF